MGCSMTQGVGCYDTSTFDYEEVKGWNFNKPETSKNFKDVRSINKKNEKRFLKYSWGSILQEKLKYDNFVNMGIGGCLLYTSPSPRDLSTSRMPSSA